MKDNVVGEGVVKQVYDIMEAEKRKEEQALAKQKKPETKLENFVGWLSPFAKTLELILRIRDIKFNRKLDALYSHGYNCYPHCYIASISSVDLVIERDGILTAYIPLGGAKDLARSVLTDYKEETSKETKIEIKI